MPAPVSAIGFSSAYPTRATWHPRQPVGGRPASTTWAGEAEIFRYDLITPYGVGTNQVANPDQTSCVMVAWDLKLKLSVLVDQDTIFRLYANLFDGTSRSVDQITLVGMSDVQVLEYPAIPCFFLFGTFERNTVNATALFVHASMVSY